MLVQSKCLMYYFLANYFWHPLPFLSWCIHQTNLTLSFQALIISPFWLEDGMSILKAILVGIQSHIFQSSKIHVVHELELYSIWYLDIADLKEWTLYCLLFGTETYVDQYRGLVEDRKHSLFSSKYPLFGKER